VAEEALVTIEKNVCNVLHASPQQLKAILDSPSVAKHDLSSLQKIVLGSARLLLLPIPSSNPALERDSQLMVALCDLQSVPGRTLALRLSFPRSWSAPCVHTILSNSLRSALLVLMNTCCVQFYPASLKVKDVMVGYTADNVAGVFLTGSARENPTNPTAGRLLPHLEAKIVGGGKAGNLHIRGCVTFSTRTAVGAAGSLELIDTDSMLPRASGAVGR